jgi:predicted RNase H-like HicB family nuclease
MQFTANIEQGDSGWFVGQIVEVPAAMSQGKTIKDLKENLLDALNLILDTWQTPHPIKFNLHI